MNTRFDYEAIREHNQEGWQQEWLNLLEGRFCIENNELIEDMNAPIFRLGFTVTEVTKAIGFKGYTARETEWYTSQPDRWRLVDGTWEEIDGWREAAQAEKLLESLNTKLAEVDDSVAAKQRGTFSYEGHQYYMDRDYISDQIAALPYLPTNYQREWKTAEKNGVDNVYVVLDKAALVAMAMACFKHFNDNWSAGDAIKKHLKTLYAGGIDVSTYEIVLD